MTGKSYGKTGKRLANEKSSAASKVRTKGFVDLNYVFYRVVHGVGFSNGL